MDRNFKPCWRDFPRESSPAWLDSLMPFMKQKLTDLGYFDSLSGNFLENCSFLPKIEKI
jgi:hypothetical protein